MANEVTSTVEIAFDDDVNAEMFAVMSRIETSTGKQWIKLIQTIGITEEAINSGDLANIGPYVIKNLDETNFVDIKVATGGAVRDRLLPDVNGDGLGGWCAGTRMGGGSQAPFAIADTDPCKIAFFFIEQ